MQQEIKLNKLMDILQADLSDKTTVIIDSTGNVETFLKYKGDIIEINKLKLKQQMSKLEDKELDTEIRHRIVSSFRLGGIVALFLDSAISLDLIEFLGQFKWFDKSAFFNSKNMITRDYFVKHDMITKDEDKDNFGNVGYWAPAEKSRLLVVVNGDDKDIETVKKNFSSDLFQFVIVK